MSEEAFSKVEVDTPLNVLKTGMSSPKATLATGTFFPHELAGVRPLQD